MILAHDVGTSGNKASLHDDDARLVASVTVAYPTRYAHGGIAEQSPQDWWDAFCAATRSLLEQTATPPEAVTAIALSGQMMGMVLLDGDGLPVRPAIIWADTRSEPQCRRLGERIGAVDAYRRLGHRLNPTYSLTKLMWVRDHEPEAFDRGRQMCQAKDYVVLRLTGTLATDPSDASSTNAYDQSAGRWSPDVLAAAGIPAALLPEVVPSTTVVGTVRPDAAAEAGLAAGTAVVMGGGDGPMAAVGAGVLEPGDGAYAYLGSSSWVSTSATAPLHDVPAMRSMTFNHVVPGRYVPTATMQAGGGSLSWVAETLTSGAPRPPDFSRLLAEAAGVEASAEGLFFLPYLLGERSPHWQPAARGVFLGLGRHHTGAHLVRAVLEGVAFNLATCLAAFRENGTAITGVDAIGGGAASDLWLQIMADVWGCRVRRRSVVEEANSLGAAVTAGVGAGLLPDFSAARDLSTVTGVFEPDAGRQSAYSAAHARFTDAYARLEPWFLETRCP